MAILTRTLWYKYTVTEGAFFKAQPPPGIDDWREAEDLVIFAGNIGNQYITDVHSELKYERSPGNETFVNTLVSEGNYERISVISTLLTAYYRLLSTQEGPSGNGQYLSALVGPATFNRPPEPELQIENHPEFTQPGPTDPNITVYVDPPEAPHWRGVRSGNDAYNIEYWHLKYFWQNLDVTIDTVRSFAGTNINGAPPVIGPPTLPNRSNLPNPLGIPSTPGDPGDRLAHIADDGSENLFIFSTNYAAALPGMNDDTITSTEAAAATQVLTSMLSHSGGPLSESFYALASGTLGKIVVDGQVFWVQAQLVSTTMAVPVAFVLGQASSEADAGVISDVAVWGFPTQAAALASIIETSGPLHLGSVPGAAQWTFDAATGNLTWLSPLGVAQRNAVGNLFEETATATALTLTGGENGSLFAVGGKLADQLTGEGLNDFGGNDFLVGQGGDDTLKGNSGSDFLYGGTGKDKLLGDEGADNLEGGNDDDQLYGGSDEDFLAGGAGSDTLDGGSEIDTLVGDGGNDTYLVDNAADMIVELAGQGTADWVKASVTFDLLAGVDVERLSTTNDKGTAKINLYGNEIAQTITGNAAANILSDGGKGGSDVLIGLGGNDTYRVYNSGTKIVEAAAAGSDTVEAAVNYTVGAGVYIQVLETTNAAGKAAISLYSNEFGQTVNGNAGANVLRGYGGNDTINGAAGDDKISGGLGNDTLAGNAGADTYYFSYALNASTNVDTIKGFSSIDLISLSSAIFTKAGPVGALASAAFWASTTGLAHDASDRIIWETDTGILRYDPDGTGAAAPTAFAIITGNTGAINAGDFVVA